MKQKLTFLILMTWSFFASGQNFITNGGFENVSSYPIGVDELEKAYGWYNPFWTTSDLLSLHSSGWADLPNFNGGKIYPHSGNQIAGLILAQKDIPFSQLWIEFIANELNAPLEIGKRYTLSMYVSSGKFTKDNHNSCKGLGFKMTTKPLVDSSSQHLSQYSIDFSVPPKNLGYEYTEIKQARFYDTAWTIVEFEFLADSAYEYLTIGNFLHIEEYECMEMKPKPLSRAMYVFIDDVELVESTDQSIGIVGKESICYGDSVLLKGFNGGTYRWENFDDPGVILSTDSTLWVQPPKNTRYMLYGSGNSSTYIDITVENPKRILPYDVSFCEQPYVLLDASYNSKSQYLWNDGSTDSILFVSSTGQYWVEVSYKSCVQREVINVWHDTIPIAQITVKKAHCEDATLELFSKNPAYEYLWSTGETTSGIYITSGGNYSLTTSNFNCSSSDSLMLSGTDTCVAAVVTLIPNLITPNEDGINDEFEILFETYPEEFELKIYNRWGLKMYESSSSLSWNGQIQGDGNLAADGTYFYHLNFKIIDDHWEVRNGFFVMSR